MEGVYKKILYKVSLSFDFFFNNNLKKKKKKSEVNQRILMRARERLVKIRKDIYSFLISPKDAFRQVFFFVCSFNLNTV